MIDQAPVPPAEEKVVPTQIKVVVRGNKTTEPNLEIQSNGSSHFPITVKVQGRLGSVLSSNSFYKQMKLRTLADRKLDFKKHGLKPGFYDVEVQFDGESDKIKSETSLELGTSDKEFRNELAQHRKGLTHWATNERVQLIKLTLRFEDQLNDFLKEYRNLKDKSSALRDYYRGWQKRFDGINSQALRSINNRNRNTFVYAESWLELKTIRLKAIEQAGAVARAKDASFASPSLQELKTTKEDLTRLKERMVTASLWR